jgi:hypothetical protein
MRQHSTVIYRCVHTGDCPDRTGPSKTQLLMGFTVFTVQQITNLNTYCRFNSIYTINVSVSHFSCWFNFEYQSWPGRMSIQFALKILLNFRVGLTLQHCFSLCLCLQVQFFLVLKSETHGGNTSWDRWGGVRRFSRTILRKGTFLLSLGMHSTFKVECSSWICLLRN